MEFTGYGLRQHDPIAIDITASGGAAWICIPGCSPTPLAKRATLEPLSMRFDAERDERGYGGEMRCPAFEISPPARADSDAATAPAADQPAGSN